MKSQRKKTSRKQKILFPRSRDSIVQAADKLVSSVNDLMRTARTEEDLRIGCEKVLAPLCGDLGIESSPQYERSIYKGRRSDAVHGRVIIEYEKPKAFGRKASIDHAYEQLLNYIEDEAKDHKETLFYFDPQFMGVGFDGDKIFFVRYKGDKDKPKTKLDSADFARLGPFPFDTHSARSLLTYLRALSRRLLTAENLAEVFGPKSSIAPQAVSAFTDAFENWGSKKVQVFYGEWKRLFGIVYGEHFGAHQETEANALARLYGVSEEVPFKILLFCVHSYFGLLMKFIAAEIITLRESSLASSFCYELSHSSDKDFKAQLKDIEEGWTYSRSGVTNFLEGDFFSWYLNAFSPRLQDALREMTRALSEFEPATTLVHPDSTRDLLKRLYQYLVPQEIRHKLGEYYTPDWLAELTLDEVNYKGDTRKRFLDPACGSGTFLTLAIQRAREFGRSKNEPELETTKRILANIWGFDLNPLAVIASRTNYLFALADVLHELHDVEIPVYLADSVLWPERRGQIQLSPQGESVPVPTSIKTFYVPKIWITDKGFLMRRAAPLVEKMAKEGYTAQEALKLFHKEGLVFPPHEEVVANFFQEIADLETAGENGIWARFLKNAFAPMIAGKFDFVVGNPPWIRWGYLSKEYRDATLQLWREYGLFSLKGHAARLGGGEKDFSMLFTYASVDYYLKKNSKLGFLITQEVFKAKGAGEGFRRFQLGKRNHFKVLKAHDLVTVQPFEKAANKTAMIILKKGLPTSYPVPYTEWKRRKGVGKIPTNFKLQDALPLLQKVNLQAQPISTDTGSWQTISSTQKGLKALQGENNYKARLGARVEPYGVFWLEIRQVLSDRNLIVRNLAKRGKREVPSVEETVEADLIYPLLAGGDIDRWCANPGQYVLMSQDPATREPYPEKYLKEKLPRTYGYLTKFRNILLTRGSNTVRELAERTAFYAMFGIGEYTVAPYKVVWKRMASDIIACVISQFKTPYGYKLIIPSDTTAIFSVDDEDEAHYLCAIINSKPVRDFISSYSSAGRGFGAPSVMNHIGIPKYEAKNSAHKNLSVLSRELHRLAEKNNDLAVQKAEAKLNALILGFFNVYR